MGALEKRWNTILNEVESKRVYEIAALLLILALTILLRFFRLGRWSFWGDEFITVTRVLNFADNDWSQLPLSFRGTSAIFALNGVSEWSARLVPAVIGVLTVFVLYWLVRRIFGARVALLAALLLAVSPWHLYWSQNARFYSALLFFYTISLLLFYLALEEDRPWWMLGAALFFGFAVWERLLAAFLLPTAVGYIILLWLGRFEKPSGLNWRNLALFFLPAIAFQLLLMFGNPSVQDGDNAQQAFGFINNNPFWIVGGVVFYVGIPLICMTMVGALLLLWRRNRPGLLFFVGALAPLAAIMLVSLFTYSANRYVFVTLTSIIILAAYALSELFRVIPRVYWLLPLGVLLILFAEAMGDNFLYYQYQNGNRDDWKGALTRIEPWLEPDDLVISTNQPLAEYYLQRPTFGLILTEIEGVEEIVATADRIWFVLDLTAPDKAPRTTAWVRNNARFVADFDVTVSARTFPMRVYLYTAEP